VSQTATSQVADPPQESTVDTRRTDESTATVAKEAKTHADQESRPERFQGDDAAGSKHLDKSEKTAIGGREEDSDTTDRLAKRRELSLKLPASLGDKKSDGFEIETKESGGKPRTDAGGAEPSASGKRSIIELTVETPAGTVTKGGQEKLAELGRSHELPIPAARAGTVKEKGDQRGHDDGQAKSDAIAFGRKATIEVVDLRRSGSETASGGGNGKASHGAKTTASRFEAAAEADNAATRGSEAGPVTAGRQSQLERSSSLTRNTALTDLATRLRENTNAEIVRSARLVIRGSDSGEIRLNLKPETLGNVRILLEMHDGRVAGRIVVENSSVRDVFEQNLASLSRAFREEGIEFDGLDVTVSDPGQGSDDGAGKGDGSQPKVAARTAAQFAKTVPDIELIDVEYGQVNLVV